MLERAKETTRNGQYTYIEYARYADDLVVLIDAHPRHDWLLPAVLKRLREEFAKLDVEMNEEKSRVVDLRQGESFGFPGVRFSSYPLATRGMAGAIHAEAQEADGITAQAQGDVPVLSIAAAGSAGGTHQPGVARLGWLLCDRTLEPVLWLH